MSSISASVKRTPSVRIARSATEQNSASVNAMNGCGIGRPQAAWSQPACVLRRPRTIAWIIRTRKTKERLSRYAIKAEVFEPDPEAWVAAVQASALTGGPLHLEGSSLYLDRYWRDEGALALGHWAQEIDLKVLGLSQQGLTEPCVAELRGMLGDRLALRRW